MPDKIVFITRQKEFAEDVETSFLLSSFPYELKCCHKEGLDADYSDIVKIAPSLIVVTNDMTGAIQKCHFKEKTVCINRSSVESNADSPYPVIGSADSANDILQLIDNALSDMGDVPQTPHPTPKQTADPEPKAETAVKAETRPKSEASQAQSTAKPAMAQKPAKKTPERKSQPQVPDYQEEDDTSDDLDAYADDDDLFSLEIGTESFAPSQKPAPKQEQPQKQKAERQAQHKPEKKQTDDYIGQELKKDIVGDHGRTKIITVYSAKGGVGKTKVSTELAVLLSLVEAGSRRFRVCEVDCNIDFGDVRSTLNMEAKGPNMAFWADEIRDKIKNDQMAPEDITYTKEEIEGWLRHDPGSGLYVLAAPLTNEDSFIVNETAMRVMFMNLIKYGDFDYIVCDTGNNTRDTSMVALELADDILLLMTQDINTANCNKSFLKMMKDVDFDVSKVKLVVNKIKPLKTTKISVEDIENYFDNYKCIARIKYSPDVEISTNEGKPLAYDPDNEFTKQIRAIVSYVIGDTAVEDAVPAKSDKHMFGFLFKKKKKK